MSATFAPPAIEPVVLMDRFTGGILVELLYDALSVEQLTIRVTIDGDVESAPVPAHAGLDAFEHPYVYLPR